MFSGETGGRGERARGSGVVDFDEDDICRSSMKEAPMSSIGGRRERSESVFSVLESDVGWRTSVDVKRIDRRPAVDEADMDALTSGVSDREASGVSTSGMTWSRFCLQFWLGIQDLDLTCIGRSD